MSEPRSTPIAVVGAGPLGLMAALMVKKATDHVVLVGPKAAKDGRTTAILNDGVAFLKEIDVWDDLQSLVSPLSVMRLVDGTKRLIRAPEACFDARELALEAFGYNVANSDLLTVLQNKIENSTIEWHEEIVTDCSLEPYPMLSLNNGAEIRAKMIVAADGRNSRLREAAGISTKKWAYPQTALVMNLTHSRDHNNTSTEFHTETGPFTLVPMDEHHSSLVWVETPERAAELMTLDIDALSETISGKSHYILGDVEVINEPMAYPLSGLMADEYGKHKTVLIGESAHVFPPIGAQGMNLGIRDVCALRDLLSKVSDFDNADLDQLVADYSNKRKFDVSLRTRAVDALNRSLLTDFLPIHLGRGLGLYALNTLPAARKFIMRQGLGARSV